MIIQNLLTIMVLTAGLEAYKILVYFPTPSFSHQRSIMALTERLITRGHELFVISPNPVPGLDNHENYTFVDLSFSYKYFSDDTQDDDTFNMQKPITRWEFTLQFPALAGIPRQQLLSDAHLRFQRFVNEKKIKFDLVIVETFHVPFACVMTRIYDGSVPIIALTPYPTESIVEDSIGSISHMSYKPSVFNHYTNRMNLWQKMDNWFADYYVGTAYRRAHDTSVRGYLKEMYGSGSEKLADDCWSNVSLALVASNPLYYYPRLLGPNVVEVGPLHLKTPEKLPKRLQDWLDGAEKGAIYFSLGSNVKSKSLPAEVRSNFLRFFREHPEYRVVWKWELDGEIPGQSDNILTQKWLPQDSVLAHPKLKAYIMQGGLQSFQEAVHYGVPLVGIPFSGDQDCNVGKIVDAGIGVKLEVQDLHAYEKIKAALEAVLFDERYSKNMKRHSSISRDFTSKGMDQAVFWVEHVAKHGGASHLRPATADSTMFQYFCLDIISILLIFISFVIYTVYCLGRFAFSFIVFKESQTKIKKS
nr:PREDICTED: UDP-glucuronosyltransferase 2B2-like [Bemisia tabaci]